MVITCSRNGLLAAWRRPGLAILLWAWSVLLALPLTLPAWTWLRNGTATTPDADLLLERFSFGVMGDLLRTDPSLSLLVPAFLATALVAVVGQALTNGGLIEVLTSDDGRPFLHRFFRGAGHFFWRFLRAAVLGALVFMAAAFVVVAIAGPIGRVLGEVDWEPAWYLGQLTTLAILGLVALVVILALDYARIRMVRDDSRHALRAFAGGLVFVVSEPRATAGLWVIVAAASAILFSLYLGFCAMVPAIGWASILLGLVAQQLTMLARAGVRVALVAGEIEVWTRLVPSPGPAPSLQPSAPAAGAPPEFREPTVSGAGS